MGRDISLFSGYSQKENRTTNYCLLLLRLLYEENPKFLVEFISALTAEDLGNSVGVQFRQQKKTGRSIPDGCILQQPFSIYLETKNFDWFYEEQMLNHLDSLYKDEKGMKALFALSNFENVEIERFDSVEEKCGEYGVIFRAITFEEFFNALENIPNLPKAIHDILSEFHSYLDEEGLLPIWKTTLDVVNCSTSSNIVYNSNAYVCPAGGGSYSHKRARFFGLYEGKSVSHIADILSVVDAESEKELSVKWINNESLSEKDVKEIARKHLHRQDYPKRIFLLDKFHETSFQKDSKGGLYGSKTYFDLSEYNILKSEGLAILLNGKKWSELKK